MAARNSAAASNMSASSVSGFKVEDLETNLPGSNDEETGDKELGAPTVKEESSPDPDIVGWDGPNDPQNPLNWSSLKKYLLIGTVAWITLLGPLSSTVVAPATDLILDEFPTTNDLLGPFVTSVQLIGYAFGPLFLAPLSELYGRSILYHTCNVFFLVFTIACAVANSLGSLIAFRFLVGIAASCSLTIGAGSIADLIPQEKRGAAMSSYLMGPMMGPTIGPLIGGYLSQAKGWRWVFWLITILSGVTVVLGFFSLPETSAYAILERKTKMLRKKTGNQNLRSAMDTHKTPKALFRLAIVRPIKMFLFLPIVSLMSIYLASVYGYVYLCFTTFPRVFEGQYGFTDGSSGLAYLGIGVGAAVGVAISGVFSDRLLLKLAARNDTVAKPEYRLPLLMIGAVLVPSGLFWYAWTAEYRDSAELAIVGTGFLGSGMMVAFVACSTYLVDAYTVYAASAIAATTVLRSLMGALLPLAGEKMYDALGVGWGTSILGFISVAFLPVPLLFMKYGERIRKSKRFHLDL